MQYFFSFANKNFKFLHLLFQGTPLAASTAKKTEVGNVFIEHIVYCYAKTTSNYASTANNVSTFVTISESHLPSTSIIDSSSSTLTRPYVVPCPNLITDNVASKYTYFGAEEEILRIKQDKYDDSGYYEGTQSLHQSLDNISLSTYYKYAFDTATKAASIKIPCPQRLFRSEDLPHIPISSCVNLYNSGFSNYCKLNTEGRQMRTYFAKTNTYKDNIKKQVRLQNQTSTSISNLLKEHQLPHDMAHYFLHKEVELPTYPIKYFSGTYHSGYSIPPVKSHVHRKIGGRETISFKKADDYNFNKNKYYSKYRIERTDDIHNLPLRDFCRKSELTVSTRKSSKKLLHRFGKHVEKPKSENNTRKPSRTTNDDRKEMFEANLVRDSAAESAEHLTASANLTINLENPNVSKGNKAKGSVFSLEFWKEQMGLTFFGEDKSEKREEDIDEGMLSKTNVDKEKGKISISKSKDQQCHGTSPMLEPQKLTLPQSPPIQQQKQSTTVEHDIYFGEADISSTFDEHRISKAEDKKRLNDPLFNSEMIFRTSSMFESISPANERRRSSSKGKKQSLCPDHVPQSATTSGLHETDVKDELANTRDPKNNRRKNKVFSATGILRRIRRRISQVIDGYNCIACECEVLFCTCFLSFSTNHFYAMLLNTQVSVYHKNECSFPLCL